VDVLNQEGEIKKMFEVASVLGNEQELVDTKPSSDLPSGGIREKHRKMGAVPIWEICMARSGDKGDTVNIGVLVRSRTIYEFIKLELTEERIADLFSGLSKGKVIRFEIHKFNGPKFLVGGSSRWWRNKISND
jgi:hypothetical protein